MPKKQSVARTEVYQLRLSADEKELISSTAELLGVPMSTLMMGAIMGATQMIAGFEGNVRYAQHPFEVLENNIGRAIVQGLYPNLVKLSFDIRTRELKIKWMSETLANIEAMEAQEGIAYYKARKAELEERIVKAEEKLKAELEIVAERRRKAEERIKRRNEQLKPSLMSKKEAQG